MKMDAFVPAIPELVKSLGASKDDAHRAAVAITTTDLVSKEAALQVRLEIELRTSAGIYLQGCKSLYCGMCGYVHQIGLLSVSGLCSLSVW
jgi:glutamate N-acetyltransferase/amino-acid N-acetyltransferase